MSSSPHGTFEETPSCGEATLGLGGEPLEEQRERRDKPPTPLLACVLLACERLSAEARLKGGALRTITR